MIRPVTGWSYRITPAGRFSWMVGVSEVTDDGPRIPCETRWWKLGTQHQAIRSVHRYVQREHRKEERIRAMTVRGVIPNTRPAGGSRGQGP